MRKGKEKKKTKQLNTQAHKEHGLKDKNVIYTSISKVSRNFIKNYHHS